MFKEVTYLTPLIIIIFGEDLFLTGFDESETKNQKFFFLVNEVSCFSACGSALCLINIMLCILNRPYLIGVSQMLFQKEDEHKRERESCWEIHGQDARGACFLEYPAMLFINYSMS